MRSLMLRLTQSGVGFLDTFFDFLRKILENQPVFAGSRVSDCYLRHRLVKSEVSREPVWNENSIYCVTSVRSFLKIFKIIMLIFLLTSCLRSEENIFFSQIVNDSTISISNDTKLNINSNIEGAKIYLDDVFIGVCPLTDYNVQPGIYKISVTNPDERSWYSQPVIDSVKIRRGEVVTKFIELNNIYLISSQPSDADVFYKDSLIGRTPFVFYTESASEFITLKKDGYKDVELIVKNSSPNMYVLLELVNLVSNHTTSPYLSNDGTSLKLPVYIASGSAVIFGINAAWLKIKADSYYSDYQISGDKTILNKVKKYDKLSGISLVVCQLSSFLLAYLLLSN